MSHHIHDMPASDCFRSGHGVAIGRGGATPSTGSASIRFSLIDDYQLVGILVLGEGSTATITHNVVQGPGASDAVATDGIEFTQGAGGTDFAQRRQRERRGSPPLDCGPDFFTELQHAGIYAEGPGTVISENLLYDNQVGIYAFDGPEISRNVLLKNHYFGAALQDGFVHDAQRPGFVGGGGDVAVIAAFADTTAKAPERQDRRDLRTPRAGVRMLRLHSHGDRRYHRRVGPWLDRFRVRAPRPETEIDEPGRGE